MSLPKTLRVLLAGALASALLAQAPSPAQDLKKLRSEAQAAVQAGDYETAAASFKRITEADPKDSQAWHMLGYSLHTRGKLDEALAAHQKAAEFPETAPVAFYNIACVHALKGNVDASFAWLKKSVGAGFDDVQQLDGDDDLKSLRKDPRYAELKDSMGKANTAVKVQVFEQNVARKNARAAWFTRKDSPGQIAIDWSPVPWKPEFDTQLQKGAFVGKAWRLGADFWTRLDTSYDLQCGATAVPAGYYYLTLQQRAENDFVLSLHDPVAVRKQKLDAFQAEHLRGGLAVPLVHAIADDGSEQLEFAVTMKKGSTSEGEIVIRFGSHVLSTPFQTKVD